MKSPKSRRAKFLIGRLCNDPPKKMLTIFKHGLVFPFPKTKSWILFDCIRTATIVMKLRIKTATMQLHIMMRKGLMSFSIDVNKRPDGIIQTIQKNLIKYIFNWVILLLTQIRSEINITRGHVKIFNNGRRCVPDSHVCFVLNHHLDGSRNCAVRINCALTLNLL